MNDERREECIQALNDIKMLGSIRIPIKDLMVVEQLIEEHFNPKFLKIEDLKQGMWVWDILNKCPIELKQINEESKNLIIEVRGHDYYTRYVDNRFYPIQIPKAGGKE